MHSFKFKSTHTLEERLEESNRIICKYPDRTPVIVEINDKDISNNNLTDLDKNKYLVPSDLSIGQFMYVIRKRIKLRPEQCLFLFCNNCTLSQSKMLGELYDNNKDKDGFLYICAASENTFG